MTDTLTVWDGPLPSAACAGRLIAWSSYGVPSGVVSVPAYLDAHGLRLRSRYAAFIGQLGAQSVQGVSLARHLEGRDGLSLWWMSQLAEKSPFKSPNLYACLRLLALEELLVDAQRSATPPSSVRVASSDPAVRHAVARLCGNLGLAVATEPRPRPAAAQSWALRAYQALPWRVRGLLSLRHVLRRWPSRALRQVPWLGGAHALFLASYFFNLGREPAASGLFHSHQWEDLPELLRAGGRKVNWLHHLLLAPTIPRVRDAMGMAKAFNHTGAGESTHRFIESYLGLHVLAGALAEWWRLGRMAERLRPGLDFRPQGSQADLWPLLEDDWHTSFRGPVGLSNSVVRRLLDRCLKQVPRQHTGLYLWENQGWEAAFVHAWRRHGHGRLVGVPHSTIAFWHLNNFDDPSVFDPPLQAAKPLPDGLAVNGPAAYAILRDSGYPQARLHPVEALRFQYLARMPRRPSPPAGPHHGNQPMRLLFLGDFTREQTLAMAVCLERAIDGLPVEVTFRPHPVCPVQAAELGPLARAISRESLIEALTRFDWAFASNSSSAGLDAYLGGLRVAVFLDDASLNHSPLRGESGVHFVNDHHALSAVLAGSQNWSEGQAGDYFWLDQALPRWSGLLGLGAGGPATDSKAVSCPLD